MISQWITCIFFTANEDLNSSHKQFHVTVMFQSGTQKNFLTYLNLNVHSKTFIHNMFVTKHIRNKYNTNDNTINVSAVEAPS